MRILLPAVMALFLTQPLGLAQAQDMPQSPVSPQAAPKLSYPRVVLFSTSWCPHCKAAKEYFTRNNIPFINRDVEIDSDAMELLTGKYKSQGVPVIVIGDDAVVLKGFDPDRFEKAVQQYKKK